MESETFNLGDDFNFLLQSNGGIDVIFDTPSNETSSTNSPTNSENMDTINFTFFNPQAFDNQNGFGFVQKEEPIFEEVQEFVGESPEIKQEEGKKRKRAAPKKESKKQNESKQKEEDKPKKIRRKHPEMQTAVTLSREKLLTTTSEEFNNWVEDIKRTRPLTQEEIKDIRRQKRLIKNRESAQASRDRKRFEVTKLEAEIFELRQQRDDALRQLSEMKSKVDLLETENSFIKSTYPQSDLLNNVFEGVSKIEEKAMVPHDKVQVPRNLKNAGICLFILIFSFGLFFNAQSGLPRPGMLSSQIPKVQVADSASPSLNAIGTRSRTLLSKVQALGASNLQTTSSSKVLEATTPIVPPNSEKKEKPATPVFAVPNVVKTDEFVANQTNVDIKNQEIESSVHLYCTNAKEYSVNNNTQTNDLIISLMIPKTSFSSSSKIIPLVKTDDDLVEVKCRVLPTR